MGKDAIVEWDQKPVPMIPSNLNKKGLLTKLRIKKEKVISLGQIKETKHLICMMKIIIIKRKTSSIIEWEVKK